MIPLLAGLAEAAEYGEGRQTARDACITERSPIHSYGAIWSRVGLLATAGYRFARPDVGGEAVQADALRAQLGIADAIR